MRKRRILIYGPGNAREHATWYGLKDKRPDLDIAILALNQNALLQREANVTVIKDLRDALIFSKEYEPDDVYIPGPTELIAGDADVFRKAGYKVFGVSQKGARLESSKIFAKEFMRRHQIPTPDSYTESNISDAENFVLKNWGVKKDRYVIKTDLFTMNAYERTETPNSVDSALKSIRRLYGVDPNTKIIFEEYVEGYELSFHLLVNGERYYVLPPVQDYKKLSSGNDGPMTHGVAAVAAAKPYPDHLLKTLTDMVIKPTLSGLIKEKIHYQSILYIGLIIKEGQPMVLEYNVRSGNPEWLSLLGLLDTSLVDLLDDFERDSVTGRYWKEKQFSITSFGLARGYPQKQRDKYPEIIKGIENIPSGELFGESIVLDNGEYHPSGGRIFAIRKNGNDFTSMCRQIENKFNEISMDGLFYRTDLNLLPF